MKDIPQRRGRSAKLALGVVGAVDAVVGEVKPEAAEFADNFVGDLNPLAGSGKRWRTNARRNRGCRTGEGSRDSACGHKNRQRKAQKGNPADKPLGIGHGELPQNWRTGECADHGESLCCLALPPPEGRARKGNSLFLELISRTQMIVIKLQSVSK